MGVCHLSKIIVKCLGFNLCTHLKTSVAAFRCNVFTHYVNGQFPMFIIFIAISLIFSNLSYSPDYTSCVLRVVIVLENEVVTNKRLSNGHGVVDEYLLVFGCSKVISDVVYRCPTPLYVIEPQTCRDLPHVSQLVKHSQTCTFLLFGVAHIASNCFQRVQTFSHL